MLRPGRLDTLLFVGLPDAEGRVDILRTLCKKLKNFNWNEEIGQVARGCEGFSGADLESLLKNAGYAAVKRFKSSGMFSGVDGSRPSIEEGNMGLVLADFETARSKVSRSVGADDMKRYDLLQREWGKSA